MNKIRSTLLYLAIVLLMTFFSSLSQKSSGPRKNNEKRRELFFLSLSFLVGWFFIAFTKIGTDYENYSWIIRYSKEYISNSYVEIGFNGICYLFFKITKSVDQTIFWIKTITIFFFFISFYLARNKIIIWPGVLFYGLFLYLRFYLLSMVLASSLIFLATSLLLIQKNGLSLFFAIIACTIHSSCFFVIPVFFLFLFLGGTKRKFSGFKNMVVAVLMMVVVIASPYLYNLIVTNMAPFKQYGAYGTISTTGFGLLFFAKNIPLCVVWFNVIRNSRDHINANLLTTFMLFSLAFDVLSYSFSTVSRISYLLIGIQCLLIPSHLFGVLSGKDKSFVKSPDYLIVWTGYVLCLGLYTFVGILNSPTSRIEHYIFNNPFI